VDLGPRFAAFRDAQPVPDTGRRVLDLLSLTADAGPTLGPATAANPATTAVAPPPLPDFGEPDVPLRTVVLDPGHGGDDAGVRSADGPSEKDVTLAVARRLQALLEGRLGIRVLLTRDEDRPAPLDRRTAVANNNKADVFISLHANASPRAAASGASVRTAMFDERESARASLASERLTTVGGRPRDLDILRWDLAQVRHLERSRQLASFVARQLGERVPMDSRPVGAEPLRVLESANMPAIVVEMGYLTNPAQAAAMRGADFQASIAQALFDALIEFRAVLGDGGER
jgi:N-acetylmuramoyl-L-alanine amidase